MKMKLIMILVASLLPFLHETRYEAEVKGCDAQGITLSAEGELFHAELFNMTYTQEEGWQDVCAMLEEADEVSFEVDPEVSLEETASCLFVRRRRNDPGTPAAGRQGRAVHPQS